MEITFTNLAEYKASNGSEKITILNLANRRQVGGVEFCPYSGSQEEDLIRCGNLYWLLHLGYNEHLKQQLTEKNINDGHTIFWNSLYTKHCFFE